MNIFKELWHDLQIIGQELCTDKDIWSSANLEVPKDPLNGDISTNIAMLIAAKSGTNPRSVSIEFKERLAKIPYIAHIEVAGPGFINFTIKAEKWHECIKSILNDNKNFWQVNIGHNQKINIEYVSANPTGPMHIGHARGAVYGDTLANILDLCGYDVTKEYYVNDSGAQIKVLLDSAFLRYKEIATAATIDIPEGMYPGAYLKDVGQKLFDQFGNDLLSLETTKLHNKIKDIVVGSMLDLIKEDLAQLGVHHDEFFSEQYLHDNNKIKEAIDLLTEKGLIYKGVLPPPKGKIDPNWKEKEQLLFRSSNYGDAQDRPVQKNDGTWSYLAADFAYAKNKIDRGFDTLVYILGADHSGYVKRIQAVIEALGDGKVRSEIKISQLVNFIKDNKAIKMSKRSGNFMTVQDVTNEVGKDIIRFMMLTRRNDMVLDFDFAKVKQQSKNNPVFYVQYAHVRARSIITKSRENIPQAYEKFVNHDFDLSLLSSEEEIQLIKLLASWPKVLESSAKAYEPHRIAYYLIDVASRFHAIWNLGKEDNDYRFNVEDDIDLTAARLALAKSINKIIAVGFGVIGVQPMEKM